MRDDIEIPEPHGENMVPETIARPLYRFRGDAPPPALRDYRPKQRWVTWGYLFKGGKWTKVPFDPKTGKAARVSDASTWGTFDQAIAHLSRKADLAGVGIVLVSDDDLSGIDLDHCITEGGMYSMLAAEIIGHAETYAEVSPSGQGVRLFVKGKAPRTLKVSGLNGVEVYNSGRYLTVTGDHIADTPADRRPAPRTHARLDLEKPPEHSPRPSSSAPIGTDADRIRDALRSIPSDDRDVWVRVGMALKSELGDAGFGLWREWSQSSIKFDEADTRRKWSSFKGSGITVGTVFALAREYGWSDDRRSKSRKADAPHAVPERADARSPQPDMSILKRNQVAAVPFPVDLLGEHAAKWIRLEAACKSAPLDYVALGLLAASAGVIGAKRRVSPWDGWSEPSIIWGGLIGDPATNKSPSIDTVTDAIRWIERDLNKYFSTKVEKYEEQKVVAEAKLAKWESEVKGAVKDGKKSPPEKPADAVLPQQPIPHRILVVDATTEKLARILGGVPGGLICIADELAGVLGGFDRYGGSGADAAFWLKAYDGRPHRYDRVGLGDEVVDIPFCAVSLLGGIQPDRLNTMVLSRDNDGLAARPLYAWPDPVRPKMPTQKPDWEGVRAMLERLASLSFDGTDDDPKPRIMRLSSEAVTEEFRPWWEFTQWDAKIDAAGLVAGALGKLPGTVLRLAMTMEYIAWSWSRNNTPEPTEVSRETMRNAISIIEEWVRPTMARLFQEATIPEPHRDARVIAAWLRKTEPKQVNARELRRTSGYPGTKDVKRLDAAIELLVEAKWLVPPEEESKPGRPRKDFNVNPGIHAKI